jgi:mono/diheme cytochrome c family protein
MKAVLKWAGYGLAGVVGLAAVVAIGGFAASEVIVRAPPAKPALATVAATGAEAVARGHRIALVQGCADCHGAGLQGRMFDDIPNVVTLYAPNLTLAVEKQSDVDLDRAIRHGVAADGRPLWVMPSSTFAHLTDAETADLIAYLRTLPPQGAPQPRLKLKTLGRIGVLLGKFKSEPAVIAAHANPALPDLGPRYAAGRQVARACVECHGPALRGGDGVLKTPDLTLAAAYDDEDFQRLMRTGVAAGGRQVGLMSVTARTRFAHFTPAEVSDLHAYLKARAAQEIANAGTTALPKS